MNLESKKQTMTAAQVQQLAIASVMAQPCDSRRYSSADSLAQGTLFPALNLPFHLAVNGKPVPITPLSELQALDFVTLELGLYLDTHPEDADALMLFKKYAAMLKEAKKQYEKAFGPLNLYHAGEYERYSWSMGPWPWDLDRMKEE